MASMLAALAAQQTMPHHPRASLVMKTAQSASTSANHPANQAPFLQKVRHAPVPASHAVLLQMNEAVTGVAKD